MALLYHCFDTNALLIAVKCYIPVRSSLVQFTDIKFKQLINEHITLLQVDIVNYRPWLVSKESVEFIIHKGTRYWSCNVSCARIIADYYQFKIFLKIVVFQAYIRTYLSRAFIDSSHLGVLPNTVSNLWTFPNREIVRPQSSWYLPLARNAGKATKPTEIFDISCSFFYDCNLDFTWISKLSISFPRMTSIMRIWRKYLSGLVARGSRSSKSGFSLSRPRLCRDSGFSSKIWIIPTKSGWLDTLPIVLHFEVLSYLWIIATTKMIQNHMVPYFLSCYSAQA